MFTFRSWRRVLDSLEWKPATPLVLCVHDGENATLEHLFWITEGGKESAVTFDPEMLGFYGHDRLTDGGLVEVRGEFESRSNFEEDPRWTTSHRFNAEIEYGAEWLPVGELRLLIDDGAATAVRWIAWRDREGNTGSVALRSVSPSGNSDVTDLVTEVRASGEYLEAGALAANLLTGLTDKWLSPSPTATLEFRLAQPVAVASYELTSANDEPERDPTAWTLQGSLDGQLWEDLDSRVKQAFSQRHQSKAYLIAKPGVYVHYRIEFTGNNGSPYTQLANVRFLASGSGGGFIGFRQRLSEKPFAYRGSLIPLKTMVSTLSTQLDPQSMGPSLTELI